MELTEFFKEFGLSITVISILIIALVGVFKIAFKHQLEKVKKENRKPIYETVVILTTLIVVAIWTAVKFPLFGIGEPFSWTSFLHQSLAVYGAVKVMYPIYENYKLRDLVKMLGKAMLTHKEKETPTEEIEEPKEVEKGE